jgi:D-3-phosphoglycerate dehydrogenase
VTSVLFTQRFLDDATRALAARHDVRLVELDLAPGESDASMDRDTLAGHLAGMDGWIVGHARIDRDLVGRIPSVKVIARRGVGFEKVDIEAARAAGKVVTIARGGNEETVADHAVALMLAVGRRLPESFASLSQGEWKIPVGRDLYRKTVGLIGMGAIGSAVARRLSGFECRVLVHTRSGRPDAAVAGVTPVDLDTLLGESDYVSLHTPLSEATRGMIDAPTLARMAPGAILINTARAQLVDEPALLEALRSDHLWGAGLDMLASETDASKRELTAGLLAHPRVVVTPHSAGSTAEALARANMIALQSIIDVLEGRDPEPQCVVADGRTAGKTQGPA